MWERRKDNEKSIGDWLKPLVAIRLCRAVMETKKRTLLRDPRKNPHWKCKRRSRTYKEDQETPQQQASDSICNYEKEGGRKRDSAVGHVSFTILFPQRALYTGDPQSVFVVN